MRGLFISGILIAMFFGGKQSAVRGLIEWVFYFFIALFPFILYRGFLFNGTSTRSINLIIMIEVLAVIVGFALFNKKKDLSIAKSPVTAALFLFFLVSWISSITGVDFLSSFWSKATRTTGLFYFTHLALFYLFLFMLFREEIILRRFLKIFLISSGLFSVIALGSQEGFRLWFETKDWDAFTFGNSTFAAMYLFAAFTVSIYYIWTQSKASRRWWKYLLPLVFLLNPYFLNRKFLIGEVNILENPSGIVGEARATTYTVVFAIGFLFVAWLISRIKKVSVRRTMIWSITILGLIVVVLAVRSFLTEGGYLRSEYLKQASSARPIVWELSHKAIVDRPMFGWGIDNFDRAFEQYYDNRLLEERYGNEAWFDRAHNIFIDQTVDTGYIGLFSYLLVYFVIIGSLLYVLFHSKERNDLIAAVVLLGYFVGHILELQTAFDTSISYVSLTIMAVFAAVVFQRTYASKEKKNYEWIVPKSIQYIAGVVLIAYFGWAFFAGAIPIARAEIANGTIRTVGSAQRRLQRYNALFGSPLDKPSFIWRTTTDFQRGIMENPSVIEDPKKVKLFVQELDVYAKQYREYLEQHPTDYRPYLNLADIYIYKRLFGIDNLNEAHTALDQALTIVPQAPQAYWMKAVAYLYQQKFDLAKEWAQKAYDLNPGIEESKRLIDYINRSIKTFPEIDLYFFRSI